MEKPIQIYEEELAVIKTCGGIKDQKLLFTLLCYSKASNPTNNWVTTPAKILFQSAGINLSIKDQDVMIYNLKKNGFLINSKKIISNNIKINIPLKENSEKIVKLEIDDLRSLGAVYQAYLGGSAMAHKVLKKCRCCGAPFIDGSTKNNIQYCSACKKLSYKDVSSENEKMLNQ